MHVPHEAERLPCFISSVMFLSHNVKDHDLQLTKCLWCHSAVLWLRLQRDKELLVSCPVSGAAGRLPGNRSAWSQRLAQGFVNTTLYHPPAQVGSNISASWSKMSSNCIHFSQTIIYCCTSSETMPGVSCVCYRGVQVLIGFMQKWPWMWNQNFRIMMILLTLWMYI